MSLLSSAPSTLRPLFRSPPIFLAPALAKCQTSPFTTTPQPCTRKTRDGNPNRGVSALRRTGLKYAVGMSHTPLPKPVLDPKKRTKVETDPNHGLWGFFNKKRLLSTPEMDASHGRPWTMHELRHKSWEDIHCLWWICCKERNRLATEKLTRRRLQTGGGDFEAKARDKAIRQTQKAIKWALTERWYAWEDAWRMAKKDPEVDLQTDLSTPAYKPFVADDMFQPKGKGSSGRASSSA